MRLISTALIALYAALAMLQGDAFSKKFGGPDGTDADWFLLTIEGFDASATVRHDGQSAAGDSIMGVLMLAALTLMR